MMLLGSSRALLLWLPVELTTELELVVGMQGWLQLGCTILYCLLNRGPQGGPAEAEGISQGISETLHDLGAGEYGPM